MLRLNSYFSQITSLIKFSESPVRDSSLPKRMILIDGSNLFYRSYHSTSSANLTHNDQPVGAIFNYIRTMLKLFREVIPNIEDGQTTIIVAGESKTPTLRKQANPEYKSNRPPIPNDLKVQLSKLPQIHEALNVHTLAVDGYEADDIIATLAEQASNSGIQSLIISSDKDLFQCINSNVTIFDLGQKRLYDADGVVERFGCTPQQLPHLLALTGDKSDNLPGVPGIGPKTAAKLIAEFGTIDNILDNSESLQSRLRTSIRNTAEQLEDTHSQIQLYKNAPVGDAIFSFDTFSPNSEKLISFLQDYSFDTIITQLKKSDSRYSEQVENMAVSDHIMGDYKLITSEEEFEQILNTIKKNGKFSFFFCSGSTQNVHQYPAVGIALCTEPGKAYYFSWAETPISMIINKLKPLLLDKNIKKACHDAKHQLKLFNRIIDKKQTTLFIDPVSCNIDDTMLLSYCLCCGKHSHKFESAVHAHLPSAPLVPLKLIVGTGQSLIQIESSPLVNVTKYACQHADYALQMFNILHPMLENDSATYPGSGIKDLYLNIERPLISTLADMELTGVFLNTDSLNELGNSLDSQLGKLQSQIFDIVGEEFNVSSAKQLGEIMFDKLGTKSKTARKSPKSNQWITNNEILEAIAQDTRKFNSKGTQLSKLVLDFRSRSKLTSTYVNGLKDVICEETGRIHTVYQNALTVTGRLSSVGPNLQNIPTRSAEGRLIRNAFEAKPGFKMVFADYSQVELRILAHIANIPSLIHAFETGIDIHSLTASQVFKVPLEKVPKSLRQKAKAINFGIIYGMSEFGLAKTINVSRFEAKDYIEKYFNQYPGIRDYIKNTQDDAKKNGYVETGFGRRCFIHDIDSKSLSKVKFAERTAINTPIQGTSADITKVAMNEIYRKFLNLGTKGSLIMQVHDEIIFEVADEEIENVKPMIQSTMEGVVNPSTFRVPLTVGIDVAPTWGYEK